MQHTSVDTKNTTVIDITYLCNASCNYCQWGNLSTPGRVHLALRDVLLPEDTLDALGTKRVVLSGGEPRLNPEIEGILRYYNQFVDEVIVISNGYGLNSAEVSRLIRAGATGFTVSLDSISPEESLLTRRTPSSLHADTLENLRGLASESRSFELGLNSVVSHVTANWCTVRGLLEFAKTLELDFVKFQPVFNDGYVEKNAPDLILKQSDLTNLLDIASRLGSITWPITNPPEFWRDLALMVEGKQLAPGSCGLGTRHSIATRGKLNVCYWLDSASFGGPGASLSRDHADEVRRNFETAKLECKVGHHCFCTQSISHDWKENTP